MATLWVRVVATVPVLAIGVACGGSSAQFLGAPEEDGGKSSEGDSTTGGGSDATSGGGGDATATDSGGTGDGGKGTKDASRDARVDASPTSPCNYDGGAFPTFEDGCTGDDACVIEYHQATCCGDALAIGINHSAAASFDAAEIAWMASCTCPACPISSNVVAQDGDTGPKSNVRRKCDKSGGNIAGQCTTFFN